MIRKIALGLLLVDFALTLYAANTGFDQASNSPYEPGNTWTTGQNGGSGFGPWTLEIQGTSSQAGVFIGSSTGNAGGSLGIDTAGVSWGMYANSGQIAEAFRSFTSGSMLVGQTFRLSIDTGVIQSGGNEGFFLQGSGGTRFEFYFLGGQANYTSVDGTGTHNTGIGFTGNGLNLAFTLTTIDSYSLAVTPANGG